MNTRYWLIAYFSLIPPIITKWSLITSIYKDDLRLMDPFNWLGLGAHSFFSWILQILFFVVIAFIYWIFTTKSTRWLWFYLNIMGLWSIIAHFIWVYLCDFYLNGEEK